MADIETKAQQATTENGGTVVACFRMRQVFFLKWLAKANAVYNPKTLAAGLPSRDGMCYPVTRVLPTATFLNHDETLRTGQHAPRGLGVMLLMLFNCLSITYAGTHATVSPGWTAPDQYGYNYFDFYPDAETACKVVYSRFPDFADKYHHYTITRKLSDYGMIEAQCWYDPRRDNLPPTASEGVNRFWYCVDHSGDMLPVHKDTQCPDDCPENSTFNNVTFSCEVGNQKGTPDPTCDIPKTDNPISISAGNKVLRETDYVNSGITDLSFIRMYNSTSSVDFDNKQGFQWRNRFNYSITFNNQSGNQLVHRPGGKVFTFAPIGSNWRPDPDITDKLVEFKDTAGVRTGWVYTVDATGEVETYDTKGKLLSIKNRGGLVQTMTYSCTTSRIGCPVPTPVTIAPFDDLLIKVTDSFGRSLHFIYDLSGRLTKVINPQGGVNNYGYDSNSNLTSVTYPDGKTKTYLYENKVFIHALNGINDENNNRYATYRYDAAGRAYDEELAPALNLPATKKIDHNNLVYNVDSTGNPTSTVVTDALGSKRTYNFTTILGVVKSTGQSQPGGAGCSASASNITYDINGNVASRTDFDGHKTTYRYDMARNLETSRTEGLTTAGAATPATRTMTTTWHPKWRLPLVTADYTGTTASGTPVKKITNVYDTKGNLTSFTESDPARNLNRTTTITYTYSTAVPGLVLKKVVNGPRTDVNDVTTYSYYPHNAVCTASAAPPLINPITGTSPANLGCRGQLLKVTNALNQTITYNRYNHHGQVEQMTDANGLVTVSTYDLRQRLTSQKVGTELTKLTYDNAGQIIQLTLPDNSFLKYRYDAAHRLIQVQDTLGNKVVYTLDAAGNRIKEQTKDPTGVLAKTLTRSYDALNRLQKTTGLE